MDDVSPLRSLDRVSAAGEAALLPARRAYRFAPVQGIKAERSHVAGRNPPYGADINFWAPGSEADEAGGGDASAGRRAVLRILGPEGDTIRTLSTGARPGINRVWWDLRYEPTRRAKIRTAPPGLPWVPLGPEGWRPLRTWDLDLNQGQLGPRVVPGTYQVALEIDGATLTTPLEVLKDPHSEGALADVRRQVAMSLVIRDEINEVVAMIDRIEWARRQLEDLAEMLAEDPTATELLAEAKALEETAVQVESNLFDIYLTGAREDAFRNPMKLYGRLSALSQDVGWSSADFPPTVPQTEVHEVLQQRLEDTRALFEKLFGEDAEALNRILRERRLPIIVSQ